MQPLPWGGVLDKAIHAGFKRSGIASSIAVAVEMEGHILTRLLPTTLSCGIKTRLQSSHRSTVNLEQAADQSGPSYRRDTLYWRV